MTSDKIGEVFDNVWKLTKKTNLFPKAQVPLWKLNLSSITDDWKVLHGFTGTKDKPSLNVGLQPSTSFAEC